MYPTHWPQYFTATIQSWKHLFKDDDFKDIILDSFRYLTKNKIIDLYAFVIMSNHIHLIWQALYGHTPSLVQTSFMKYTSGRFLKKLRNEDPELLKTYEVNKYDRKHQFWKREPLAIDLFTPVVFQQKLDYIHKNPVRAGICELPYDYKYSSSKFYEWGIDEFGILSHYSGN